MSLNNHLGVRDYNEERPSTLLWGRTRQQGNHNKKWRPTEAAKEDGILMLAEARLASEGSAAAAATPPKKNVRTYYCSKNHHADSYRHQAVPFLVDRILKLATTNVAVNLSYDGDFSLCVASMATHFNAPLNVVLSLRDRFEASRKHLGDHHGTDLDQP